VDTTKTITHVSLCAGYGGIDLGLKRAIPNMRTIAFSEIEAYACSNLVAKMEKGFLDAAPIWTNLKTFPWSNFRGKVDILSGGYPCQPFSAAGKRLGKDDPRHLWPYIADGVRLMQPRLCFFENVEGHISLGLREVIEELESIGYQTTWGIFSASEVGATHRRKRMFILAHTKSCKPWKSSEWQGGQDTRGGSKEDVAHTNSGGFTSEQHTRGSTEENSRRESDTQSSNTNVAQPNSFGSETRFSGSHQKQKRDSRIAYNSCNQWPSGPKEPQYDWEPPRVLGNTSSKGRTRGHECGAMAGLEKVESLAESNVLRKQQGQCKAESSVGGNTDGDSNRLDYAELYQSVDNRTDELRLLGNGVVPATATLAFQTLLKRL